MKKLLLLLGLVFFIGVGAYAQIERDTVRGDSVESSLPSSGGTLRGDLLFSPDGTYNIGADGANRPKDIFVEDDIHIGETLFGPETDTHITIDGGNLYFTANGSLVNTIQHPGIQMHSGKDIFWSVDGGGDIGSDGANRPDDIYVEDDVVASEFVYGDTLDIDIPDSGDANPAVYTEEWISQNLVIITCSDNDGCNFTFGESDTQRKLVTITNDSANTVNFSDTSTVSELAGAFAMGQYDTLNVVYIGDRWVEVSRSNN